MRPVVILGVVVASLAGIAAAAGVFLRGDLSTFPFTTVRGEAIDVVADGVYRYNADSIVAEGVGWDLVTLLLVVPAALVTAILLWRGSVRAALVMAGLLAYFTYQYFEYAVFWAYGPLYPLQLLTAALAVSTLAILVARLDLAAIATGARERFPARLVAAYGALAVALLAGLWLPVIAGTLGGDVADELQGATTLVVPVFDLGLLVPLAIATAVTAYRRLPVSVLLGVVLLVKGVAMGLAIVAMLLVEWQVTGEPQPPPVVIFAALAAISLAIGWRAVRAIGGDARPTAQPALEASQSATSASRRSGVSVGR
jgi:hypothetical protein